MSQLRQSGDYLKDNRSNKCYHCVYTGTNKINQIKTNETFKGNRHFLTRTQRGKISKKGKVYNRNIKDAGIEKYQQKKHSSTKDPIMADSQLGVQTRSMTDTQCNNPDQLPVPENNSTLAVGDPIPTPNLDPQNPALNVVVESY